MSRTAHILILGVVAIVPACSDPATGGNESEVITTITLTFTPPTGAPVVAVWNDPDGDGGITPTVDPIAVTVGTTYALTVGFENRLEDPPEIITDEVRDEGDAHQVFLTGPAVNGPASLETNGALIHSYADADRNGLPIGLANTIVVQAGNGIGMAVTLRHMPPVNGVATKSSDASRIVATTGFGNLPGTTDAQVMFPVAIATP